MDSVNGMTVFIIMAIVVTALVKVVSLLNDNYNATHNQPTRSRTPPVRQYQPPGGQPQPAPQDSGGGNRPHDLFCK